MRNPIWEGLGKKEICQKSMASEPNITRISLHIVIYIYIYLFIYSHIVDYLLQL